MIKPMIAAEDIGSNYLDTMKQIEDMIDSRLQNIILHKDIDSGKPKKFSFNEFGFKIEVIFYLETVLNSGIYRSHMDRPNIKIKFKRTTDKLFSIKEVIDELLKKYSKAGWENRLEIIYENINPKDVIFKEDFLRNVEGTLRLYNLEEKTYILPIGILKGLIIKGTVE